MSEKNINLEVAENIVDKMYQDRMKEREEKLENGTVIHLGIEPKFSEFELASIRLLREEIRLHRELNKKESLIDVLIGYISTLDNFKNKHPEDVKKYFSELAENDIKINSLKEMYKFIGHEVK